MNITLKDLFKLSLRFNLRILIEKDYISFYYGSKTLNLYDVTLKKLTKRDVEMFIRKMVEGGE